MDTIVFAYRPPASDTEIPDGPLSGMRVLLQPDLFVKNWPADAGSKALAGFSAVFDATVIARLRAAGAVPAGFAPMAEFGFGINGSHLGRILAADEFLHAGLMTDMLGEARMAASLAGLWGFKPSWGRVSRYGLTGLVPSMECTGVLAKKLSDIPKILTRISGADANDPSMRTDPPLDVSGLLDATAPAGASLRIGIPEALATGNAAREAEMSIAREALSKAGFTLKNVTIGDLSLFAAAHQVAAAVEASSSAGKYDGVRYGFRAETSGNWNDMYLETRGQSFGPLIKALLMQGAWFQFQDYPGFEAACTLRQHLVNQTNALFNHVDLIALPTREADADPLTANMPADTYDAFSLTLAANLTGLPVLQVPGTSADGPNAADTAGANQAPGFQLMGPAMGDIAVLRAGLALSSHLQGVIS